MSDSDTHTLFSWNWIIIPVFDEIYAVGGPGGGGGIGGIGGLTIGGTWNEKNNKINK